MAPAIRPTAFTSPARKLGIDLCHSEPYVSEGRGGIERFNRTAKDAFEVEVRLLPELLTLEELNAFWRAWLEERYDRRRTDLDGRATDGSLAATAGEDRGAACRPRAARRGVASARSPHRSRKDLHHRDRCHPLRGRHLAAQASRRCALRPAPTSPAYSSTSMGVAPARPTTAARRAACHRTHPCGAGSALRRTTSRDPTRPRTSTCRADVDHPVPHCTQRLRAPTIGRLLEQLRTCSGRALGDVER